LERERGVITLRVIMRGKSAHAGRQFEGVNAFERSLPAMMRLAEIRKGVELRETKHNIAPAASHKSTLLLSGPVEAGTNFNVTPEYCSFTIDRRINPEENLEQEERRLRDALGKARSRRFKTNLRQLLSNNARWAKFCPAASPT